MSKRGGRGPDRPGVGAVGGPPRPGEPGAPDAGAPDGTALPEGAPPQGAKVIPFQRKGARCPTCGKTPAGREFRPFCSKRCADIDLGRWLKEGYRIPGPPALDEGVEAQGEGIAAGRDGDGPDTRDNDGTPYDDGDLL